MYYCMNNGRNDVCIVCMYVRMYICVYVRAYVANRGTIYGACVQNRCCDVWNIRKVRTVVHSHTMSTHLTIWCWLVVTTTIFMILSRMFPMLAGSTLPAAVGWSPGATCWQQACCSAKCFKLPTFVTAGQRRGTILQGRGRRLYVRTYVVCSPKDQQLATVRNLQKHLKGWIVDAYGTVGGMAT